MYGEKLEGYTIHVLPFASIMDMYTVEFWPHELQQAYVDGKPRPVASPPKAIVEFHTDDIKVNWDIKPLNAEVNLDTFENAAKASILQFRNAN